MGTRPKNLIQARQRLIDFGVISYKKGTTRDAGIYRILSNERVTKESNKESNEESNQESNKGNNKGSNTEVIRETIKGTLNRQDKDKTVKSTTNVVPQKSENYWYLKQINYLKKDYPKAEFMYINALDIGHDFLSKYDVLYDYAQNLVTLIKPAYFATYRKEKLAGHLLETVPLEWRGHIPIMQIRKCRCSDKRSRTGCSRMSRLTIFCCRV